jgi:hypothetical protein
MKLRLILACTTAAFLGSLYVITSGATTNHSGSQVARTKLSRTEIAGMSRLSRLTRDPVTLPSNLMTTRFRAAGYGSVFLIGSNGKHNFYEVDRSTGAPCNGVGGVGPSFKFPVGILSCPNPNAPTASFPSPRSPILDLSLIGADAGQPTHIVDLAGLAADSVAAIGVLNSQGQIVLTVPVKNNVFASGTPLGVDAVRLEALDGSGNVIYVQP